MLKSVLNTQDVSIDTKFYNIEESYFNMGLDFILESQKEFNEANKSFYKSVSNGVLLNEATSEFVNNISTIIDRFIKFIRSLVDKFIKYIQSIFNTEKFIKENKKYINEFTSSMEFEESIFNYSFDDRIPVTTVSTDFLSDFRSIDSSTDMKLLYDQLQEKLANQFYNTFRAEVLGLNNEYIDISEYYSELSRVYRSGMDEKENTIITYGLAKQALDRFLDYRSIENSIKTKRTYIEKEYNLIRDEIRSKFKFKPQDNVYVSADNSINLPKNQVTYTNLFVKAKVSQIEEMCKIHTMAFSAKLDALKECYLQDRAISLKALRKITTLRRID